MVKKKKDGAHGGLFGSWTEDDEGLACFDYERASAPQDLVLPQDDPRRPWHQVGNDRLIATAHAGGWTTLYLTDRGYWRLSDPAPGSGARVGGIWRLRGENEQVLLDPVAENGSVSARWGMGYAQWKTAAQGIELERTVWAPFGDVPALRMDLTVRTKKPGSALWLEEEWGLHPYYLILAPLMTGLQPIPSSHKGRQRLLWQALMGISEGGRRGMEAVRRLHGSALKVEPRYLPEHGALFVTMTYPEIVQGRGGDRPSWIDTQPQSFFLARLDTVLEEETMHVAGADSIALQVPVVRTQKSETVSFAIGTASEENLGEILARLRATARKDTSGQWKKQVRCDLPQAPWLGREASWHGYYLRSAQVHDDYFEARILPQGSAYGYLQGLHGAPRDYLLALVPLTYMDPAGAKDCLRLIMRMTRPDGTIYYAHTGYGKCTWAGMHTAPSDLPLWWMWALSEYIWATGDIAFLDEEVPFYPKHKGKSATVRDRVALALNYLKTRIGLGEHMMLKVGSGDWSDPISLMVKSRTAFHDKGESGFNTAFAVYALPRAADLIEESHPNEALEMRLLAEELEIAMGAAWNGKWFLRGWDGLGNPIGRDHLFLEGQVWALIAGVGDERMRKELVRQIAEKLDEPSPIGATILDRPHWTRLGVLVDGWDCNGGIWAAINGLLCWAYALHDPKLAWRNLQKQSLAAHASAYPNIWYGIWSGPDAYNAHYADRPGETFVHAATPMREYPVMNSNAHALPLLGLLRMAGVETTKNGIEIRPRIPGKKLWSLETPLLSIRSDGAKVTARTRAVEGLGGKAKVRIKNGKKK